MGYGMPRLMTRPGVLQADSASPNILIVVFDALSASNMSVYGYGRPTTPNLERLADRAIVYHKHYASANFTSPGTASLLTGTIPWTHRAIGFYDPVRETYARSNIFRHFDDYYRLAYTHNPLANVLLTQFLADIEARTPLEALYLTSDTLVHTLFQNDPDIAGVGWNRGLKRQEQGSSYSLFLAQINEYLRDRSIAAWRENFPLGLPSFDHDNYYILEQGIDWLSGKTLAAPQPFLGYFHFYPPHSPYHPPRPHFQKFFEDDFHTPDKPMHFFRGRRSKDKIRGWRRDYDEFVRYADAEFARLFAELESGGLLENTWVILTADHGEVFERGIHGHTGQTLFQPVINIPLLIFPPGQSTRVDIFEITSAVDVLPTLAQLAGKPDPEWGEGRVIPPFTDGEPFENEAFSLQVEGVDNEGRITNATATMVRGDHKIMHFFGYPELADQNGEIIEIYNLTEDPEELHNLYPAQKTLADELLAALHARIDAANEAL